MSEENFCKYREEAAFRDLNQLVLGPGDFYACSEKKTMQREGFKIYQPCDFSNLVDAGKIAKIYLH